VTINSGAVFSFDLGEIASPPNTTIDVIQNSSALQSSCAAILRENVNSYSGMYWIKPEFSDYPIAAYCDMSSLKGGWQMCYTDWKEVDLKNSRFDSSFKYGKEGYRSDCSMTPFDEIIFFDHNYNDLQAFSVAHEAAFQYQGRNSIVASLSDWNGTALGLNGFPVYCFVCTRVPICPQSCRRRRQLDCNIGCKLGAVRCSQVSINDF
jgi:hypothetical protein